jgi:hypothetical protein
LTKVVHSWKSKKLAGPDDILPYVCVLKKFVPYMLKPLLELINASIREGVFPSTLQKLVVKPIYKKGMKEDANNYHPITLVPALSKSLEKVTANS